MKYLYEFWTKENSRPGIEARITFFAYLSWRLARRASLASIWHSYKLLLVLPRNIENWYEIRGENRRNTIKL